MNTGKLVLFDLDGTLVDSAPDIALCVDGALAELGVPQRGFERIRSFIGSGAEQLIHRALTNDIEGMAPVKSFDAAYASFSRRYAEGVCNLTRLYPGVENTLGELAARGWQMGCVTNKPSRFTDPLLRELGLESFFAVVLSGDSLRMKKPDPEPLLYAAQVCGAANGHCIMVGDSLTDVAAARAAGMPVICVSYGYDQIDNLIECKPDALVDTLPTILDLLNDDRLFASARCPDWNNTARHAKESNRCS